MRIGEFAQLGQVSVRMLRHYESMDLLTPDSIDPITGHRSYTVVQLTRLNRIMALSALGISLRKIAVLLDSALSTTDLTGMLNLRRHPLRHRRRNRGHLRVSHGISSRARESAGHRAEIVQGGASVRGIP